MSIAINVGGGTGCNAQPKPESWFHSTDFDAECRRRRAQQQAWFQRKAKEMESSVTVADPDEFQPSVVAARNRYFDRANDEKRKRGGDPCQALPRCADLQALADTFGVGFYRLEQAMELQERHGLISKAKRLALCKRIGRRQNCTAREDHKFFQPYMCRCRYCETCGPAWFRRKFSELLVSLEPVVEHLLHEGEQHGRTMVVAKLDFTVPSTGEMPTREFVRKFHADIRRFWRAAERRFGISRKEYGVAGCDEFGGKKTEEHPLGNTNLHRHCVYVGPVLPQRNKELSALWSEIRGERSFVSIKRARSFSGALAHALKYPAKFLTASTPARLAELEAAFHRTRRFSASAAFYNVEATREPGDDSPIGECPRCGAKLVEVMEPWVPTYVLEAEGRCDVGQARREAGRAKVLLGAMPP